MSADPEFSINEWGNYDVSVGIGFDTQGVHLYIPDPDTNEPRRVFIVEPEFARRIAESLTLRSFECEDARRAEKSSGG